MRRRKLQEIEGLSKHQIDKIMDLHQADVNMWKKRFHDKDLMIENKEQMIISLSNRLNLDEINKLQDYIKCCEKKYELDLCNEKRKNEISLSMLKAKSVNEQLLLDLLDSDAYKN